MAVGSARCGVSFALALVAFCWLFLWSPRAGALEAFDGRIQAHGFVEMQIRGLAEKYGLEDQELDLAQWYNILNVELEFDILPDGFGPIDLMSAFVRTEVRYDCIYSHGCEMIPSADAYGNDLGRLPKRLIDAVDYDYAGVIEVGEPVRRIQDKRATPVEGARRLEPFGGLNDAGEPELWRPVWNYPTIMQTLPDGSVVPRCDPTRGCPGEPGGPVSDELNPKVANYTVKRLGFPGFDTFMDQTGADLIPDTADDPGLALLGFYADYRFGLKAIRGPAGAANTQFLGPWRPKDKVNSLATLADRANPFRGRVVPAVYSAYGPDAYDGLGNRQRNQRYNSIWSGILNNEPPFDNPPLYLGDLEDDWRRLLGIYPHNPANPGYNPADSAPKDPLATYLLDTSCPECAADYHAAIAASLKAGLIDPFPEQIVGFWQDDYYFTAAKDSKYNFNFNPADPTSKLYNALSPASTSDIQKFGGDYSGIIPCVAPERNEQQPFLWNQLDGRSKGGGCIPFENIRVTGGRGELPLRPAPDRSNLFAEFSPLVAQGLYIPSPGLLSYLREGDFDNIGYNFSEAERAWNRGASQQDNKELKEAYLDIEFLDSRLWARLGLQNIVWGKTELFRTTDQFNPVDIGLAGPLAGLEESRIALWAARFVYSLYNVGPLEDVRVEFAANLDDFEPIDLGACGEPYTINLVCSIPTALWAHGAVAVGIAGIDDPPPFWKDIKGLEFGGRVEWRWDRFSFALADFYGYEDTPFADAIYYFDRSVEFELADLETGTFGPGAGRPLASGFTTGCTGMAGEEGDMVWASADRNPKSYLSTTQAGIGRDPACLKPGGAAGGLNQNGFTVQRYDPDDPASAPFAAFDPDIAVGDILYARVNQFGNPLSSGPSTPGAAVIPIPCDKGTPLCEPLRYQVELGVDPSGPYGEFADGWSPQNALENHTANQQFFSFICTATLTIGASLDPGACAWTIFASPSVLLGLDPSTATPFSEVMTCILAGESGQQCVRFLRIVTDQLMRRPLFRPSPLAPLNRDANDGVITAMHQVINTDAPALCFFGPEICRFLPAPGDLLTLDSTLTNEQRALLGCGPYFGTRCDTASRDDSMVFCNTFGTGCAQGGGIDFQSMEASVLMQSMIGFDGSDVADPTYTSNPDHPEYAQWGAGGANFVGTPWEGTGIWLTTSGLPQPGTIEFVGGPICTRFVKELGDTIVLPGCRGANAVLNRATAVADGVIRFQFDDGYDPGIDGCVLGATINGIPVAGQYQDGSPVDLSSCFQDSDSKIGYFYEETDQAARQLSNSIPNTLTAAPGFRTVKPGARTLWHPFAGCFGSEGSGRGGPAAALAGEDCLITLTNAEIQDLRIQGLIPLGPGYGLQFLSGEDGRDYEGDFFLDDINAQSQIFRTELAAFSWNFQLFLVQASCDADEDDITNDPECFDPNQPFAVGKCSWSTPQFCTNVKGFFGAAGVMRNTVRAGGNGKFGRRTFIWHSGGELVLGYQRRNVFGFSMDFAEDVTKSNWGVEFTWIAKQKFFDNNDFEDNVSESGVLNLTVSVDRPTFINFLNQNRTFFINSQWFFQYIMNYHSGFPANGPLNVLFTVAIFTGYFQDRLNPQFVTVYDFGSRSGALFPSVTYRFTEAFSAGVGLGFYFGRTQIVDMPMREFGPAGNRAGGVAGYHDGVDNMLSLLRDKDEVWVKLRWTF